MAMGLLLLSTGCQTPRDSAPSPPWSHSSPDTSDQSASSRRNGVAAAPVVGAAPEIDQEMRAGGVSEPLGVETFDAAWRVVRDTYFDPTMGGRDWDAVREELRPRAAAAVSQEEVREVIAEMVGRLGASHFRVLPREEAGPVSLANLGADSSLGDSPSGIPPRATIAPSEVRDDPRVEARLGDSPPLDAGLDAVADEARIALDVRLLDGRVVVTGVDPAENAYAAGLRMGWTLVSIEGRELAPLAGRLSSLDSATRHAALTATVESLLRGPFGSVATVVAIDGYGRERTLGIPRSRENGTSVTIAGLPTMHARLEAREAKPEELLAAGANVDGEPPRIGVIRFNVWMVPIATPFHRAIDQFRDADAIIVDLRGNHGGLGGLATGIAGHFCDRPASLGVLRLRHAELDFAVNPRRVTANGELTEPFAGPVAVIVDAGTASTSEIFAGGLQALGRVRVFGQRTAGAALPAQVASLPNGDALLHAVADFTLPNGQRVEGRGVVPDEEVPVTRANLLCGRDEPLLAALRWASRECRNRAASGLATPTAQGS